LISIGGSYDPRWSSDGTELFYLRPVSGVAGPPGTLMRVAIEREGTRLTAGQPEELFEWSFYWRPGSGRLYGIGADGRFLMVTRNNETGSETLLYDTVLVQNWLEELKRRVPTD
jgi:hypothetical protein